MRMHTKGPWEVDGFNITSVIKNEGSETWPQWKHICDCNYGYDEPLKHLEYNKANAILIAASPEMLDLLVEALPIIHEYSISGIQDKENRLYVNELERRMKNILHKATRL